MAITALYQNQQSVKQKGPNRNRIMAAAEDCITDVKSLEISRTTDPELTLPLNELRQYKLYDGEGNGYWFGDMHKSKKTIIIFVRHFLCFAHKEYIDDLALLPNTYLEEANVRLIVIGCGPWKYIQPFREATGYNGFLFVDPSRELYRKLDLKEHMTLIEGKRKDSKHTKSGFLMGTLKSMVRGMRYQEMQGDYNQQGGSIILGPGDAIHHIHRDRMPTDHTAINDLLGIAGVTQVNYSNDRRVLTI